MKREHSRSIAAVVVAAIAIAAGVGGIAEATSTTATHSPTIHACAAKKGGELRLAKSCKSSERAVSWSEAGPAGPSAVYEKQIHAGTATPVAAKGYTRIMTLRVPAGSYLLTLTINATVGNETSAGLFCHVGSMSNLDDYVDSASDFQSASAQDVQVFKAPTTLDADCSTFNGNTGGTAGIYSAQLTAVQTGSVHS